MLRTLKELETIIGKAFVVVAPALKEIKDRKLYEPEFPMFAVYLFKVWGRSLSWFDQTCASAKKALAILEEHGAELGNENAARILRAVDPELEAAIVRKAQKIAGQGNPLLGRHLSAVQRTLTIVCDTDGFVDDGDGGMIAFDAACQLDIIETIKRGKQYAVDGAKRNGWSKPYRQEYVGFHRLDLPDDISLEPGTEVEIKWRIVEMEVEHDHQV